MKYVTLLFLASLACAACAAEPAVLKLAQTIPLPGVQGRFDHFALDVQGQRLFVAALGNNTLEVVDLAAGKRLKSIIKLHRPTGVLYLAEQNQIAVANSEEGMLMLYNGLSYAFENGVGAVLDADNVRFAQGTKQIYVGHGDGALAIIDTATAKVIANVKLAKHPESFQLEKNGNRIFVNVPDAKQVAVIDREKKSVVATWPVEKFQANFPMALDEANHRLFVGCRQPARLVVFDTGTGKPVADLEISGDTDDLFFDVKRQRLYLSCGEGFLDVIQRRTGDHYERIARQPTRGGARTSFYSPDLDRLYLAVPQRNGQDAEIRVYQPG
jgi:YVTN family beta-propeller protein